MRTRIQSGGLTITNCCNLSCIHCYAGEPTPPSFMPYDKAINLLEKFIKLEAREIILTGGEPLLHPSIEAILKYAGETFPKIPCVVTTNGTLLRKEIVDLYKEYSNLAIQISLDGCQKSTHEAQHDKNTYESVISAIQTLQDIPQKRKTLRMTISKLNYKDSLGVAEVARKYGWGINYSYVCKAGRAVDNWDALKMSMAQMIATNELIRQYGMAHPEEDIQPPKSVQACPFENRDYVFGVNIDPLGNVNVCTCLESEYIIGNAYDEPLESIIESPKIDILRNRINIRKQQLRLSQCQECSALPRCNQGCIGRAARNGDEMGLDDQCDYRRALQFKNLFLFSERNGK